MVQAMNKIYAEVAASASPPDLDALKQAAAAHLDGRFFRKELLRLQGDLASAGEQRDNALLELGTLATNFEKRGQWIEQLQRGQEEVRQALEGVRNERAELQQALEEVRKECWALREALVDLQADQSALQQEHQALTATHQTLLGRLASPLRVLPASWQARVKKWARRRWLGEGNNG